MPTSIAISNPLVPDGEFWHHPQHISSERYQGVYNNGDDAFYSSVISADTKFWRRGDGSAVLQSFAQINSGIAPNSDRHAFGSGIPEIGTCATHSYHTKRIYDVSVNWDGVDSINFLNPINRDEYFLWNRFDSPYTPFVDSVIAGFGPFGFTFTSHSQFIYSCGVYTKMYSLTPTDDLPITASIDLAGSLDSTFNKFGFPIFVMGNPYNHIHGTIGYPGQYTQGRNMGMIFTTNSVGLDHINWWYAPPLSSATILTKAFVEGLNRHYGYWLTASEIADGVIDITSSFGIPTQEHGALEGLSDISIYSRQLGLTPRYNPSASPPAGFPSKMQLSSSIFHDIRGWDIQSLPHEPNYFYHDAKTQNDAMWKGPSAAGFQQSDLLSINLERSRTFNSTWTGSIDAIASPFGASERYFNNVYIANSPDRKIAGWTTNMQLGSFDADQWLKFAGSQPVVVKRPTCECTELIDFFNIPYQIVKSIPKPLRDLSYYKLRFSDGYSFVAGGLLRLFTYNPHFQKGPLQSGYPGSQNWPGLLTSRTVVELYNNSNQIVNNIKFGFIKCADIVPGTTSTSGFLTLIGIEKIQFDESMQMSSSLPPYLWNQNLDEYHFNIDHTQYCPAGSDQHHNFYPHMTRVHTRMSDFTSPLGHSHFDGVIMIENGLYVGFETHRHITFDQVDITNVCGVFEPVLGSISINSIGGLTTPQFELSWSNGATDTYIDNLAAGFYTCSVTDIDGYFNYKIFEILQSNITAQISKTDVSCFGMNDGYLSIILNGGIAPYEYQISSTATNNFNESGHVIDANGVFEYSVQNLYPGNYTFNVTDGAGCTESILIHIIEPVQITATFDITPPTCYGGSNGTAKANALGFSPPYTYLWSDGQTTNPAINLSAGNHTVTITDTSGCTLSISTTMPEPTPLTTCITYTNPVLMNTYLSECANSATFGNSIGTATVTPNGGTPPYTYLWNTSPGQYTPTATGLAPGDYACFVTDANGCTAITSTVTLPVYTQLVASIQKRDTTPGQANGAARITPAGGAAPYTYLWTNGATTQTVTGLPLGPISVTVTDQSGCTVTVNGFILINIVYGCTDPLANNYSFAATTDDNSCVYYANYYANSAYGCTSGCTDPTALNYDATAAINNGYIYINDGSCAYLCDTYIATSVVDNNVSCFGGSDGTATVSIAGSFGNDSYLWSDGQTSSTAVGLAAGTYTCTVTDGVNGCTSTVSVTIIQPTQLSISTQTMEATPGNSNGAALAIVTGGTAPYTYLWSPGGQTTNPATGLAAGTYSVTVTDANGCTVTDSASVLTGYTYGCLDPLASNYIFTANSDDGGCLYDGCTDATANNYDASANNDDGSCCYVAGCTDLTATNYNSNACFDDGSCTYGVPGCTDPTAFNYNASANTDDGSCIAVVNGCTDSTATNYNAAANTDDGSCIIPGCTDPLDANYDPNANCHDSNLCCD